MKSKKTIGLFFAVYSLFIGGAAAQTASYRYDDATQLWRLTDNAAGLGIDHSRNRGYAEFGVEHREGDYHRVQEGGQCNQLSFTTERYQSIGQLLVGHGRFEFDMDRTKERAWCDVMRPYNANPYFGGSSVKGKYDTQQFDLSAALSTIPIPLAGDGADRELTLGVRLDYKVGDLSRLRDPRSRSELLDYRVAPGLTYTIGSHTLGLSGHYDRRKEKIPNMTTVQQDPNLMYYQMTGMENATGLVGGYSGFSREWVNHQLGAGLDYSYSAAQFSTLNSIGLARGTEDAWGTYKYEPGKYTSYIYKAASHNRVRSGRLLHAVDLSVNFGEAYADEYRQTLIQEKDPEKGFTSYRYETLIEYKKRYQVKTTDMALNYRLYMTDNTAVNGYLGAAATLQGASNKHLLTTSQLEYRRLNFTLEGGYGLLGRRLWLDAAVTYSNASKADLTLADAGSDYALNVLQPDMLYYDANYWRARFSAQYDFPFTLKGFHSTAYVKASADILKADHSLDRQQFGFTFGLYN